jgi:thiol:disulfide interchange protein
MKIMSIHRKAIFSVILLLSILNSSAQIHDPVKWSYTVNKVSDTEAELVFKAKIEEGWHLYSQNIPEGGPIPTSFQFTPSPDYVLVGKTTEGKVIKKFEKTFEMELSWFENSASFTQKIKIKTDKAFSVKGELEFMVCNDEMCLPPTKKRFEFKVAGPGGTGDVVPVNSTAQAPAGGCCGCDSIEALLKAYGIKAGNPVAGNKGSTGELKLVPDPLKVTLDPGCGDGIVEEDKSVWGVFLGGFIGGLIALLTPCVFPMIPLTVSFFTKQSKTRRKGIANALTYAASIIVIYVTLGLLITAIFGAAGLNEMASNAFFNMLFFVVFVIFAISFLGAFEITLPSSLSNKADAASERGGKIGIFFMAFTLSLVSFSCTGPIIGTLLVEAARGEGYVGPAIGMFGFALALALPFGLFAAFPGWLNSLPKSGGWLNSVKVSLGFLELALALKFLSNVDLAYHWGILTREVFIALWVVLFGLWGFYLLGKLRFSHDSESKFTSIPGFILAVLVLSFTLYMLPGIWGSPLKIISGYLPPSYYTETSDGPHQCPHNLNCFHDYEEGMKFAKQEGKPVLVDFTGYSCVNCRKMEDNVWPNATVLPKLRDDYVLISLYVDDKKALPENMKFKKVDGEMAETYGEMWSDLEQRLYNANAQPYYVLLDNEGKVLAPPRGYTPIVEEYVKFLDEGLCRYKKRVAEGAAGL